LAMGVGISGNVIPISRSCISWLLIVNARCYVLEAPVPFAVRAVYPASCAA
jgi:hypothetical protein